jgi:hypothetical protein
VSDSLQTGFDDLRTLTSPVSLDTCPKIDGSAVELQGRSSPTSLIASGMNLFGIYWQTLVGKHSTARGFYDPIGR